MYHILVVTNYRIVHRRRMSDVGEDRPLPEETLTVVDLLTYLDLI